MRNVLSTWSAAMLLLCAPYAALGAVEVGDAWVRATVPGQQAAGAYMRITSAEGGYLVGASSPLAGAMEVHEMKLEGGVMKMRPLARLRLEPGKPRVLGPGSYHFMLLDLRQTLKKGERVPVSLKVEGAGGKVTTVELEAEVRDLTAGAVAAPEVSGHHHH